MSLSSDAGRVGSSGEAVYAACKGGIASFSKSIAREHARDGIAINVIAPGPTDTPLFARFDASGKLAAALERAIPMRRLAQPGDYPGLVAFLLSDEAGFITGQTISVSGGLTMHGMNNDGRTHGIHRHPLRREGPRRHDHDQPAAGAERVPRAHLRRADPRVPAGGLRPRGRRDRADRRGRARRQDRVVVPRGDTVLFSHDEVLVLVSNESEDDVRTILVG